MEFTEPVLILITGFFAWRVIKTKEIWRPAAYPRPRSTSVNSTDTRKFVSKVLMIKVDLICAVIIEMKITTKLAKKGAIVAGK